MFSIKSFAATRLKRFRLCEAGAVTVDWVVLTAAVVGLALLVWTVIVDSVFETAGVGIGAKVESAALQN